jgi:hypothetical protein
MKKCIVSLLSGLIAVFTYGQSISGYIKDSKTSDAISFANISINGTSIGTISNNDGFFRLVIPEIYRKNKISVSFIGYKTEERYIETISRTISISLEATAINISEIKVIPDSTMFTFLKKAYKKIPLNYPDKPTLSEGFYREKLQDTLGNYLYFGEAILQIYKTSYGNKQEGQVKIIELRKKKFPYRDTITNVKIYGGAFSPHSFDIVHKRSGAINPNNFKQHTYEYLGESEYHGHKVYGFSYVAKSDSLKRKVSGKFYVDAKSYAYVYFENSVTGYWNNSSIRIKERYQNHKILFEPFEDRWILKSFIYNSKKYDMHTNEDFILKNEYLTTKTEFNNVKPIPFSEQMQLTDIFADEAVHFDSTDWHDYTIIENDASGANSMQMQTSREESEKILSTKVEDKHSTMDIVLGVMKVIKIEIGMGASRVELPVNSIGFTQKGISLQNQVSEQQNIYYTFSYGYKFNRKVSLNYLGLSSLNSELYFKNQQFELNYLICLKQGGKQIFAEPTLGYGFVKSGYKIGSLKAGEEVVINGKIFDEKSTIYSGLNQQNISLGLNFKTRITPMLMFLIGGNYNHPLKTNQGIIAHKNYIIFNKTTFEPFGSNYDYFENGEQTNNTSFKMDNWQLRCSIVIEL